MDKPSSEARKRTPNNIDELNREMAEAWALLRDDPRRGNQVKELSNAAGKIINGIKLQLVYAALRGEEPDIPWLGTTSGRPLKSSAFLLKS